MLQRLPDWGIAHGGVLFEQPTPVHLTDVRDCSSSQLPTPAVNDMGAGKTVEAWDARTAKMQAKHGNGNGHGKSLAIEALRLLPTPKATNNENRQNLDRYGFNLGQALGITPLTSALTPLPSPDGSSD